MSNVENGLYKVDEVSVFILSKRRLSCGIDYPTDSSRSTHSEVDGKLFKQLRTET